MYLYIYIYIIYIQIYIYICKCIHIMNTYTLCVYTYIFPVWIYCEKIQGDPRGPVRISMAPVWISSCLYGSRDSPLVTVGAANP